MSGSGEPVPLDVDGDRVRLDEAVATGGAALRRDGGRLVVVASRTSVVTRVSLPEV